MRPYLIIVFLPLLFAAPSALSGQPTARDREAVAAFDDGIQFLLDGKPKRAGRSLEDAVALDPTFLPARRMLGLAYELQGLYQPAVTNYVAVIRADSLFSRLLYYQTGELYYRMGKSKIALKYYQKFLELQAVDIAEFGMVGDEEKMREADILVNRIADRITAARITSDSLGFINLTTVHNLGPPINTAQNDYFPFFSNDLTRLLFTRQGEQGDEDLIRGIRKKKEDPYTVSRFGSFNTRQPEGMCTLVRDGETIYFTLCHEATSQGGCDLYYGLLIDGRIRDVQPLPDYINSSTWDSQAAISCDGQQLFFASTRLGGVGGSDLYRCERMPDGNWSEPRNLGVNVNTPEDEEAPFLSNDGETLYFSSMGHNNLGDQDIFMSRWDRKNDRWTAAINLGPPVNGPHRELGFHLSPDGRTGFFASNRPGGRGGLDIYSFRLDEDLTGRDITYVSGYVRDSLTGEPIVDQEVPVTGGNVYRTNYAGRFFICAEAERELPLSVDHPGYISYDRSFGVPRWDNVTPYRIDLLLQSDARPDLVAKGSPPPDTVQRRVRIDERNLNVRFGFESAALTVTQIQNIEKFFESLRGSNIQDITISGYTDEIGANEYNLRLSQQRAEAVGRYLTRLGLRANSIKMKGFGELAGSASRELNRKVEVRVRIRKLEEID